MNPTSEPAPNSNKERSLKKDDGDIQFKVIIVGDSGVGKSCLLTRYVKDIFVPEHKVTLGTTSQIKEPSSKPKRSNSKITSKPNCRSGIPQVNKLLDQSSKHFIEIVLHKQSFENLGSWLKEARQNAPQSAFFVLVGTHSDLVEDRAVEKRDIQQFKHQAEIMLSFETSAKNNLNVSVAFQEIASQSFDSYMKRRNTMRTTQTPKTLPLQLPKEQKLKEGEKKKEGCC